MSHQGPPGERPRRRPPPPRPPGEYMPPQNPRRTGPGWDQPARGEPRERAYRPPAGPDPAGRDPVAPAPVRRPQEPGHGYEEPGRIPRPVRRDEYGRPIPAAPGGRPPGPPDDRRPRRGLPRMPWLLRLRRLGFLKIFGSFFGIFVLLVGLGIWWTDSKLNRIDALPSYEGRPGDTPGTNWLIVGSDSRAGLSDEEKGELATGDAAGNRTDTIMLLHHGEGKPTLVSLPRDSAVEIPGHGTDKLNAAYSVGGPQLLVQTVETATGIRIDHYAEIGFGGFANVVDDIGGVDLCIPEAMNDPLAGLDVPAGCQQLDGAEALGYVRTRASPRADLERVERQREFLGALTEKGTSFTTLLNPFRFFPMLSGVADSLVVDDDSHIWNLARLGWAMRGIADGGVLSTTVPIGGSRTLGNGGAAVEWDEEKAGIMFGALRENKEVPAEVIPK